MRITKYYFTEALIARISSPRAADVIARVAQREGREFDRNGNNGAGMHP